MFQRRKSPAACRLRRRSFARRTWSRSLNNTMSQSASDVAAPVDPNEVTQPMETAPRGKAVKSKPKKATPAGKNTFVPADKQAARPSLDEAVEPIPLCNSCGEPLDHRGRCEACGDVLDIPSEPERPKAKRPRANPPQVPPTPKKQPRRQSRASKPAAKPKAKPASKPKDDDLSDDDFMKFFE